MINIALLDDIDVVMDVLEKLILECFEEYVEETGLDKSACKLHIEKFTGCRDFLQQAGRFRLVFLDMDMPEMDGVEVGQYLLTRYPDCGIVWATGMGQRFKETYSSAPLAYVSKPFEKADVKEAVRIFMKRRMRLNPVEVTANRRQYTLTEEEIAYIYAYNSSTQLCYRGQLYNSVQSLSYFRDRLDKNMFIQVNRQYIINRYFIEAYSNSTVTVAGVQIKVSRNKRTNFERFYRRA